MTEPITSKRNPRLRELRRLQDRKHRRETGLFVAEGEDLVAEALRHGVAPATVFSVAGAGLPFDLPAGVEHVEAGAEALSAVSSLGSGSRVIGIFEQPKGESSRLRPDDLHADHRLFLFLHDVADPSNVGAVLRSAHAFGARAVLLSERTADPYGPKAVRASMGAIFAVPVARVSFEEARAGRRAVALVPGEGAPLRDLDLDPATVFVLGAERSGLPANLVDSCDDVAHVPLVEDTAESLNVAMTATLCLYESALHRLRADDG
jgi:RNA methyltransferase, TrmH family